MSRYCEICDAVAPMHTMTCPNHIRTSDNKRIQELEAERDELQEQSAAAAHDMCDYRNKVKKLEAERDAAYNRGLEDGRKEIK